jgi:hypothetical protein
MHGRLQIAAKRTEEDEVRGTRYDDSGDRAEGPLKLPRREPTDARRAVNRNWFNCDFRTSTLGKQKAVHPISEPLFGVGPFVFRHCCGWPREFQEPLAQAGARFAFFEVRGDAVTNNSASAIFGVRAQ